jgi:hypothetical protein
LTGLNPQTALTKLQAKHAQIGRPIFGFIDNYIGWQMSGIPAPYPEKNLLRAAEAARAGRTIETNGPGPGTRKIGARAFSGNFRRFCPAGSELFARFVRRTALPTFSRNFCSYRAAGVVTCRISGNICARCAPSVVCSLREHSRFDTSASMAHSVWNSPSDKL